MASSNLRMIQVAEDGEVLLVPFEGFEQCGQSVVRTGLLGEKSTRVHSVIWRDTDKPSGGRSITGLSIKRFERREGKGNSHTL